MCPSGIPVLSSTRLHRRRHTYKQRDGQHPLCVCFCMCHSATPTAAWPTKADSLVMTHHHPTSSSPSPTPTLLLPLCNLFLVLSSISHGGTVFFLFFTILHFSFRRLSSFYPPPPKCYISFIFFSLRLFLLFFCHFCLLFSSFT